MAENPALKIGVTGKRYISAPQRLRADIKAQIDAILELEKCKTFTAYTSLASGADTVFAELAIDMGATVKVILPFAQEEYAKDFEGADLARFKELIGQLGVEHTANGIPAYKDEDARNEAYTAAGKYIAQQCDYLLVVWDYLKPTGKGGTADILAFADLNNSPPKEHIKIISVTPKNNDEIYADIKRQLDTVDEDAKALKIDYNYTWWLSISIAAVAALYFAAGVSFDFTPLQKLTAFGTELIHVLFLSGLVIRAWIKKIHKNFLDTRIKAEFLRLLNTYYLAGVTVNISVAAQNAQPEVADLVYRLNAKIESTYRSQYFKQYAIKLLVVSQIVYHEWKIKERIGRKPDILRWISIGVVVLFFINLFTHFFLLVSEVRELGYNFPNLHIATIFCGIAMPAVFAAIEGILFFQEWEILREQSKKMGVKLKEMLKRLESGLLSEDELRIVLNELSNSMLADNENWHMVFEDKIFSIRI